MVFVAGLAAPIVANAQAQHVDLHVLHSFGAYDNEEAWSNAGGGDGRTLVAGADGNFYGTTRRGGLDGAGVIFKITPSGQFTLLHAFSVATDGARPTGTLVSSGDDAFYGTTLMGGPEGGGTIFKVTTQGAFSVVYSFGYCGTAGVVGFGLASSPMGLVRDGGGTLYGTAFHGGANCNGSVFRVTPSEQVLTVYSFGPVECPTTVCTNSDGALPETPLALGSDGNFYGTTDIGGVYGAGTVFKVTPLGLFTTLHSFDRLVRDENGGAEYNNDGSEPLSALTEGTDGNFYGTAYIGGAKSCGTVFRVTPGGGFTVLHSFKFYSAHPWAGLLRGNDGNFYGGGSDSAEYDLFRITPAGEFSVLLPAADAASPSGLDTLVQTPDGVFHGTSRFGGVFGTGAVFSFSLTEEFTPTPTLSFHADDTTAMVGQRVRLTWNAPDAQWCESSGGTASDDWPGYWRPADGDAGVSENAEGTYTYTLTCTGPGGTVTASVQVEVRPASEPVVSLETSATEVTAGVPFTLSWSAVDATWCTASGGASGDGWDGSYQSTGGSLGMVTSVPGTYTYSLSCEGPGGSASDAVQVVVLPAAVVPEEPSRGANSGGGACGELMLAVFALAGIRRRRRDAICRGR